MGMSRAWKFTCDVRDCADRLEIDGEIFRYTARGRARSCGWESPDDGVTWFCSCHAQLAADTGNRTGGWHDRWCRAAERGVCSCRPATADRAIAEARGRDYGRGVADVEPGGNYL